MGYKFLYFIAVTTLFLSSCRSYGPESTFKEQSEKRPLPKSLDSVEQPILQLDTLLEIKDFNKNISDADIRKWIHFLSQEKMSGRRAGSEYEKLMQTNIEQAFKDWGITPAFGDTYRHEFSFVDKIEIGKSNSLTFQFKKNGKSFPRASRLIISQDYEPYVFSKNAVVELSNITFVGYGISAPAMGTRVRYNSYENVDIKNKWVVLFDGAPEQIASDFREQLLPYARIEHKALIAAKRGAKGILLIGISPKVDLIKHSKDLQGIALPLPVVVVGRNVAESIFKAEDLNIFEIEKKIKSGEEIISFDFSDVQAQAQVELIPRVKKAHNIVGKINGNNPKASALIVGAHGDHLGLDTQGQAFLGADDNASGVAAVMELAQDFAYLKKSQPKIFQKDIYFAIWSAEELGNLGSAEFVREADINFSASLNFDMIGRYRGNLYVQGLASADNWKPLVRESEIMSGLHFELIDDPYAPTDSVSFYEAQIPSLNFYSGAHSDYHAISDTADKINFEGIRRTAMAAKFILLQLSAQKKDFLKYQDYLLFFKQQLREEKKKLEPSLMDSF